LNNDKTPIAILSLPDVLTHNVPAVPIFRYPVVLFYNVISPIAKLANPVVFADNAFVPIATLLEPVYVYVDNIFTLFEPPVI
jgi:hypothetical protein